MQFESLPAWLAWLETCHPREIDLGLDRIRQVAERMELLVPAARVVIVGGTNGKGSCVTATAALLGAAGYSVGVYTSPHLLAYNERIQIDNKLATDEEICMAFERIYAACHQSPPSEPISLTYFEYGTLAALEIFRQHQVTAMVLEVGLGGKLDAVNLIDADVSVVTSIDLDHQDWLGDNREDIGREKAGIYRAEKPAICADPLPPESLLGAIGNLGAIPYLRDQAFGYQQENGLRWSWWGAAGQFSDQPLPQLPLPSMAAALEAVTHLGVGINAQSFTLLANLRVPGRFQQLEWRGRQVILDVAHNPAATAFLARGLEMKRIKYPGQQVHAVVAMMFDKDRRNSLKNLKQWIDHWYLADMTHIPRATSCDQMCKTLADLGLEAEFSGSLDLCLAKVLDKSVTGDFVVIFGSFYTVAAGLVAINPVS
jgi:dihydrofolate synthase/folylpolyglutamate synthase